MTLGVQGSELRSFWEGPEAEIMVVGKYSNRFLALCVAPADTLEAILQNPKAYTLNPPRSMPSAQVGATSLGVSARFFFAGSGVSLERRISTRDTLQVHRE